MASKKAQALLEKMQVQPETYPRKRTKDATEPVEFEVTPEDSKYSVVASPIACAAVCALERIIPEAKWAWVFRSRVAVEFKDGRILRWEAPKPMTEGMDLFDSQKGLFPPGKYFAKPLPPAQRQEANAKRSKHVRDGSRPHLSRKRPATAIR